MRGFPDRCGGPARGGRGHAASPNEGPVAVRVVSTLFPQLPAGWDPITGSGSPNVDGLQNVLRRVPNAGT